jgi:imidazolonepropionase-like amidohydrolase
MLYPRTLPVFVVLLCLRSSLAADNNAILITGAKILDVHAGRVVEGRDLLLSGGKISQIRPSGQCTPPAEVQKLDLSGLVVMPGLIDLHTHLLLHPYDEAVWDDQVLKESLEFRTIRATVAARQTLDAGFTTIRDLGTEGAGFADIGLRDAIEKGIIPGPRIIAVTKALVATGCYGPAAFDPRWDMPKGAQVADGAEGLRRAVREQVAAGADWIKVYADYSRREGDPATPTFSQAELEAAVEEARSAGRKVASHATTDEGIRRSVNAGVATIEHGYSASKEVLTLMRDRKVVLCPTLAAAEAMARYAEWKPGDPDHSRIVEAKAMFKRALESGVTIACGSDAGVFAHGANVKEIELMVEYGMSPADAIRSATTIAAQTIDRGTNLGQTQEGFLADLIVVRSDPIEDLSVLREPVLVIKNAAIVRDRREGSTSRPD